MRCVTFLAVVCLCITMVLIFGTAMVLMFGMVSLFDFGCPGHLKTKRTETKIKEFTYELLTLVFRVVGLRGSPTLCFYEGIPSRQAPPQTKRTETKMASSRLFLLVAAEAFRFYSFWRRLRLFAFIPSSW